MFYFKGSSSISKGLIVTNEIKIGKARKRIDRIEIDGRNGYLTIDKGTYDPILVSVKCHLKTTNMSDIYSWLDGYGKFSLDNQIEYDAIVSNQISLEKITNHFDNILIQFELQPISKSKNFIEVEIEETPQIISISEATAIIEPIIELDMTGDISITFGSKTFTLTDLDGETILNSELKTINDSSGNISNKMLGDFPTLTTGSNSVSYILGDGSTITSFIIKYKKAFI